MNNQLSMPERATRHARILRAHFTLSCGLGGELRINNISEDGIGARCDHPNLHEDDPICIHLPVVGEMHGIVRWIHDGRCGIRMTMPIDVERVRFRSDANLLISPPPFSVAPRYQPVTTIYRPGFRTA